jgi:hypothetical protein
MKREPEQQAANGEKKDEETRKIDRREEGVLRWVKLGGSSLGCVLGGGNKGWDGCWGASSRRRRRREENGEEDHCSDEERDLDKERELLKRCKAGYQSRPSFKDCTEPEPERETDEPIRIDRSSSQKSVLPTRIPARTSPSSSPGRSLCLSARRGPL